MDTASRSTLIGGYPRAHQVERGDHAPDYLRDALGWYIESAPYLDPDIELATVPLRHEKQPFRVKRLIEELWDCTDQLPPVHCDLLDIPRGSTYADAAKRILLGPREPQSVGVMSQAGESEELARRRSPL
jgi:hypothetical protein